MNDYAFCPACGGSGEYPLYRSDLESIETIFCESCLGSGRRVYLKNRSIDSDQLKKAMDAAVESLEAYVKNNRPLVDNFRKTVDEYLIKEKP